MTTTRTIISASVNNKVLAQLDKYAKNSPYSRSELITIAVALLVGVPYQPKLKAEEDKKDE